MESKNILITGGAGYIGSHTAKVMFEEGFYPIIFDNLSNGHQSLIKWGTFIEGDINDNGLVKEIIDKYNIKDVIHLAAYAYVGESVTNPRKYFNNNIISSISFINCLIDNGIKNIVFSSSCNIYGDPFNSPIQETHPQNPINPYGISKYIIEQVLEWYGKCYELNWIALRYFNAAGADFDSDIGEKHNPETHLIPLAIDCAFNKSPLLEVYGVDYPTPDGTAIRDYTHVIDIANAHVLGIKHLSTNNINMAFNLGTGKGHSVYEVIKTVEKVSNKTIRIKKSPRRIGDSAVLIANPSMANKILGWEPKYKKLFDIIQSAWNWHTIS